LLQHPCRICGWLHTGLHLKGRPRAYYVVADGQGELEIDSRGKLVAKPAIDEMGMARTRFEYPRHRPRETSEGEGKQAAKRDDDVIDCDRALAGYVYHMIKRHSDKERLQLKYEEIFGNLQRAAYPDHAARETAYASNEMHYQEEREEAEQAGKSWFQQMEGWEDS
jgi:hypothetical protein